MDNGKNLYAMISALQRELSRQNNAKLSDFDVTPVQLHVMVFLRIAEGKGRSVCQRDIEEEFSMRASSVSIMLVNLEKLGFVTRRYADDNARTKIVELTEAGRTLCKKNRQIVERTDEDIKKALTEGEQEELASLLSKVLEAVRQKKN